MGLHGADGLHAGLNGAAWAAWSCKELHELHGAACSVNITATAAAALAASAAASSSTVASPDQAAFPLLLYLLALLILPPPPRDCVPMMALGSLLCTCARQLHAREDRHESVCTLWHTLVAEAPNPLREIHTVQGMAMWCCGTRITTGGSRSASPTYSKYCTQPAAFSYVLRTCVVHRGPQVCAYRATLTCAWMQELKRPCNHANFRSVTHTHPPQDEPCIT
eukprot:364403-Chlamydomonas_euryale.AAC.16